MFDWEDEELVNAIWDKSTENEDHIVPYPDETCEKPSGAYGEHSKASDHDAANVKLTPDGFSSLPDLSASNSTKLNLERTDEKAQVDNGGAQVFDGQPEDKDATNFVDYGWAHVGSFDDLDRLLSNNDLVYGDANIGNSEALWSSPKDAIDCSEKSELLSVESPNLPLGDLRSDGHGKTNDPFSTTSLANLEYDGGKNENLSNEKSASENISRTPTLFCPIGDVNVAIPDKKFATHKHVQMREQCQKSEAKQTQTASGPWFSVGNQGKEFEGQYRQHIKYSSSKARNQQTESFPYNQFIHPLPHSHGYNLTENPHSSLPQFHSAEEYQQVPSGSSYILDKTPDAAPLLPTTTTMMTPQEKVEKLRRRQQMRALLAIRKQQQQFRHQVSCNNYSSNLGKYSHESQQMQFTNMENDGRLSTLVSLDASSPLEQQSDSDKSTLEETILHQLENVISKLDIEIRVCIRDSLFRLAQSALQRQYDDHGTVNTNRTSGDEASVIVEERLSSTKSSSRTADGETKTNPIDRAVAHLLFHTPPGEFMHSPLSDKQTTKATSTNHSMGFVNESYENDQLSCLVEQENKEANGGSRVEIEASSRGTPLV